MGDAVTTQPGLIYEVEASSDLVHWEIIGMATNESAKSFDFEDSNSTEYMSRFYRVWKWETFWLKQTESISFLVRPEFQGCDRTVRSVLLVLVVVVLLVIDPSFGFRSLKFSALFVDHWKFNPYAGNGERQTRIAGRADGRLCALAHPGHVAAELQRCLRAGLLRRSLFLPRHGLVAALRYPAGY